MDNLTRREEVNLYEAIQKSFPKILIKDLTEHERICPVCNGLGMRIEDNVYGIKGDTSEAGKNITSHINIRLFHSVRVALMEYSDCVLIVDSLIKIRLIYIVTVKGRRKLMKKRE